MQSNYIVEPERTYTDLKRSSLVVDVTRNENFISRLFQNTHSGRFSYFPTCGFGDAVKDNDAVEDNDAVKDNEAMTKIASPPTSYLRRFS